MELGKASVVAQEYSQHMLVYPTTLLYCVNQIGARRANMPRLSRRGS